MNNDNVIEMKTGQKETQEFDINLSNTLTVGLAGAIKPFAGGTIYVAGLGAGLLLGKKAGWKVVGTYVAVNAIWNMARFATGEWNKKD